MTAAKKRKAQPRRLCRWCKKLLLVAHPAEEYAEAATKEHCGSPTCDWCWDCWIEHGGKPPK